MGHDDRERNFEKALERHLRQGAARDASAAANSQGEPASTACPDAAMLAAFHERMLSSEEMNVAKEHIAACSRCQEILARLEGTDEIEVEIEQERVLEMREPALAGRAGYDDEHLAQVRPAVVTQPTGMLKAPQDISRVRGLRAWRWVAPAGAIAAGLLIWVVARENKPATFSHEQNIQVAQERPTNERLADHPLAEGQPVPMTPAPERAGGTGRLDAGRNESKLKQKPAEEFAERHLPGVTPKDEPGGTLGGIVAGATPDTTARGLRRESGNDVLQEVTPAKPAAGAASQGDVAFTATAPPAPTKAGNTEKDRKIENSRSVASQGARNGAGNAAGTGGGETARDSERKTLNNQKLEPGIAGALTAPRAQPVAPASEMAKTAAKQKADAAEKKEADMNAAAQATAQAEVTANYQRMSSLQNEKTEDTKLILTPGGTVVWRLREAGQIERSADTGNTWSRQSSGVMLELLAGSAPSDAVCWVVGRRGTILRTTDGGRHWNKVASPVTADVGGIRATDAMHATIFDANGAASFDTSDGGVTWIVGKQ